MRDTVQRSGQQEPGAEPPVTFHVAEPPRRARRDPLAAAGIAAAGAGLIAGGASPAASESLDVFDELSDDAGGDIPVTSFTDLADPAFPRIDFDASPVVEQGIPSTASDLLYGAVADAGGGLTLDNPSADIMLGAPDPDVGPVAPTSVDFVVDSGDGDLDDLD